MTAAVAILASVVGVALAAFALVVEETGVTGTPGAMLALAGAIASLAGAVLLGVKRLGRTARWIVAILAALAAILTALAAVFLMQNALAVAMAVAFLAILALAIRPASFRRVSAP
jgi:hypothetical protein